MSSGGVLLLIIVALFGSFSAAAAPPGAIISNQASLDYLNNGGVPVTALSNEVQLVTAVIRTSADLELTRVVPTGTGSYQETVGPSACWQSGAFVPLADPVLSGGQVIDPTAVQDSSASSRYNLGEPLFLRLSDSDQNIDFMVIDYAQVIVDHPTSGDSETIQLSETGPDTGIFAGYLPTAAATVAAGDCVLQGLPSSLVNANYTDSADPADFVQSNAELDPINIVFDSQTGLPVNGATIELVDANSGLPATVYGNDGVSSFPASLISGTSVSDGSGNLYTFGPGEYRFPNVAAGNYQLLVTAPADYAAPSTVAIADLQLLPGAPFDLASQSFGTTFATGNAEPFGFDLPIDPLVSTLYLQKAALTTIGAPGDFVRFDLSVENNAPVNDALNVTMTDQLPRGMHFVAGSVTRDGAQDADPELNNTGDLMLFDIGTMSAGQRVVISYVVEIVASASGQELVNTAVAAALGGIVSNASVASIRLREDLFRSTATLIGRVVNGSCNESSFSEDRGVAGVRVYLEDGRYSVTDEGGRFHFEGLSPGGHVAQLDPQSFPYYFGVADCNTAPQFAGRADSQFVELTRGSLMRADFYLSRKEAPRGTINIELANRDTGNMGEVEFLVSLNGSGNIESKRLQLMVMLPDGISYQRGSITSDGAGVAEPRISGPALIIPLGDRAGDWRQQIRFAGNLDPATSGELRTRALIRFDSPMENDQRTPVAESAMLRKPAGYDHEGYVLDFQFGVLSAVLAPTDLLELGILLENWRGVTDIRIDAVGYSDNQEVSSANQAVFADSFELSRARAIAATGYIAQALNVADKDIQIEGRGPRDPLADNATPEGRQQNRRVEIILTGRRPASRSILEVAQASSGVMTAEMKGPRPGTEELQANRLTEQMLVDHLAPDVQLLPHVNSHRPGIAWVLPQEDFRPTVPAIKVAVKHGLEQTIALFINDLPVNPFNFDGVEVNSQSSLAVSRWAGVDLLEGTNQIVAEIIGADGGIVKRLTRSVHYSGAAVRGELLPESSVLIADGTTRPVVALRLFDRFGEPARQTSIGAFYVDEPYRSWWAVENDKENKIVHIGNREPLYTIGKNGIALIELEPTSQSGAVNVHLKFDQQREQSIDVWLQPQPRDWILVGFGQGTVGYNSLSHNQSPALADGQEEGLYEDGRLAFFAKGRIKGEYLLTLAYDSARDEKLAQERFQTEVDPTEYFPLYADNTGQRFEAPSQGKLYVKLERQQFVALFGDYSTGLSVTELSRYERRFNGLKSEFEGRNLAYSVFASETDQSFVRDEIRGDGTSGLYRLSTSPIIGNSEKISLEVRDRFDPAIVVSSQPMSRFLDYNLDNLDGTLYFKSPVPSRDADFNLIYIVAEYESRAGTNNDIIAGGRAAVRTSDKSLELGATYINEGQQGAEGELSGVDLRWQVSDATVLRAEMATSSSSDGVLPQSGDAERISVEHQSNRLDLRAYYQSVDQGFGLGQQSAAEKGISKFGIDGRIQLNNVLQINAQANEQENLDTGAIRRVAGTDMTYQTESTSATIGLVHASDEFTDGDERTSNIVTAGLSRRILNSALTVRANGSFLLDREAENGDYPRSYVLGADYEVFQGVDLYGELEQAEGRDIEASMARVGVRASPWSRAQFNSSVTNQVSEFGPRLYANVGLTQGIQLGTHWAIDLGLDKVETLSDPNLRRFDDERELAFGSLSEDFTAAFFGAMYQSEFWSANGRIEFRDSEAERRSTLLFGWYREPQQGHGLSAGLQVHHSDFPGSSSSMSSDLRLGWAFRPARSSWSMLDRVDFIYDETGLTGDQRLSWRLINNFNLNKRLSERGQMSLQYAFKYVRSQFDASVYSGYTDLVGVDFRHAFGRRWDAGVNTSVYHSYESGVVDYGIGFDVGISVRDNIWLTLGYNALGFHDEDFADARYTAHGPYLRISIKADQHTLKRIAGQR